MQVIWHEDICQQQKPTGLSGLIDPLTCDGLDGISLKHRETVFCNGGDVKDSVCV